jgi:uncharacterized protein YbjT (DUF2867 family)
VILVAGGTGHLGRILVSALVSAGEPVRVLARSAGSADRGAPDGVERVEGDVRDVAAVRAAMRGVSVCVSAVQGLTGRGGASPATVDRDGNRNLVDAARSMGASFVLLSVVGAAPDSQMELFRMKWAAEEYLRASDVPWTIVRATAFAETWADVLRGTADRAGRIRVFGRGENPLNFVAVADVAHAVLRAVADPSLRGEVIEVGGPSNLTVTELAMLLQDGRAPGHVPRAALRLMSVLARPVRPDRARLARAALLMDSQDLRFDPADALATYPWLSSTRVSLGAAGWPGLSPGTSRPRQR